MSQAVSRGRPPTVAANRPVYDPSFLHDDGRMAASAFATGSPLPAFPNREYLERMCWCPRCHPAAPPPSAPPATTTEAGGLPERIRKLKRAAPLCACGHEIGMHHAPGAGASCRVIGCACDEYGPPEPPRLLPPSGTPGPR